MRATSDRGTRPIRSSPRRGGADRRAGPQRPSGEMVEPDGSCSQDAASGSAAGTGDRPRTPDRGPVRASGASATSTSTSLSARRPTSRTTASGPRRTRPARARGPRPGWSASCCRCSTTSSARWRRRPRRRRARVVEGVRLVRRRPRSACSQRAGVEPFDPAGEPFDPTVHEALSTRPAGGHRRPGSSSTSSRRATGSTTRSCAPRAWSSLSRRLTMAPPQGPIQDPRGRQEGLRRRDQEGLPQACAPVPPGPQPGRREGRGALQGHPAGVRRPVGPREAQAVRPGRRHLRRGFDPGAFRTGGPGAAAASAASATSSPTSSAAAAAPARGAAQVPSAAATSRPRSTSRSSRRWRARRCRSRSSVPLRLPDLPRHGRQARHDPAGVPALPGPRHRVAGPGPVLDLAAVLAVRRHGHADHGPVPDLPRPRPDACRSSATG